MSPCPRESKPLWGRTVLFSNIGSLPHASGFPQRESFPGSFPGPGGCYFFSAGAAGAAGLAGSASAAGGAGAAAAFFAAFFAGTFFTLEAVSPE